MTAAAVPRLLLVVLVAATPLVMSLRTADSFVLPKQLFVCAMTVVLGAGYALNRMGALRGRGFYFLPLVRTPFDRPLVALVAVCVLSNLASRFVPHLWYAILLAYIWVFYLLVADMAQDPRRGASYLDAALFAAVIAALYGLVQDFGWLRLPHAGGVNDWRQFIFSTIGNPNFLAMVLAYIAPYAVVRAMYAPRVAARLLYLLALAPLAMCLVVCWSAGAWSGIAVALPLTLAMGVWCKAGERKVAPAWPWGLAAAAIVAGAALFYILPLPFNGREGSIVDHALRSPQWKGGMGARRFIWNTTAYMVADNPLLGVGFGNYFAEHQRYQGLHYELRGTPHDRPTVGLVNHCHNDYLQRLAETGIVGLAASLWLVGVLIYCMARALGAHDPEERRLALAAASGLAIALVHAFVDMPLFLPASGLLVLLLAAVVAAGALRRSWSTIPRPVFTSGGPVRVALVAVCAVGMLVTLARPLLSDIALRAGLEGAPAHWQRVLDAAARHFEDFAMQRHPDDRRLRYLGTAVYVYPPNYEAQGLYGSLLLARGEIALGVAHLQAACERVDRIDLRERIVAAAIDVGEAETAIESMAAIVALNPGWPEYRERLASLYWAAGNMDGAIEQYKRAQELRYMAGEEVDFLFGEGVPSATESAALEKERATSVRPATASGR